MRGAEGEGDAVNDVTEALEKYAPQIRQTLDYDYQDAVSVELFPDQNSLDQYGMNPQMSGYYAYSGDHRIQMVSPSNPIQQIDSGYSERVLIAVHEYVHLVINEINPNAPIWLNEGVAVYAAPYDLYDYACQNAISFERIPTFELKERSYNSVQAADLFAYSLVEYIANNYGQEALKSLLDSPISLEEILVITRNEFELGRRQFLNKTYSD